MAGNVSVVSTLGGVWHRPAVFGLRRMFYACSPAETSFKELGHVPDFVNQSVPYFVGLVILETIILTLQGRWKDAMRPNDAFSSVSAGLISVFPLMFFRNIELSVYIWIHNNYLLIELPWNSPVTWWVCMFGVDLGYYWVHRCAHEVNFMWAAHQVHHSSEDYNLTTALRQSMLQRYSSWIFYLPMALFMPPSVFLVHIQFNLIYQFWIHTECITRLGPLEWILNTPSHHRVHHGRNRYCIDKNYAGTLIIWDRMFGTFISEKDEDEVVYGLVHPLESWNPIYTQFCHWMYILKTAWNMPGLGDKVSVFVKGPGWQPGKPRMGMITDIPDIHAPQRRYNKTLSLWMNVYAYTHFVMVPLAHQVIIMKKSEYHIFTVFLAIMALMWTLTNIGLMYEHRRIAPLSELIRCTVYVILDSMLCSSATCPQLMLIPRVVFLMSAGMCLFFFLNQTPHRKKTK